MGGELLNKLARQMANLGSQDIVDSDGVGVVSAIQGPRLGRQELREAREAEMED